MRKKAWEAITDAKYAQIWSQIRGAIHTPIGKTARADIEDILKRLTVDETAAFFNRLCCDYGKGVRFGSDSNRKRKLLHEFEIALDLINERRRIEEA